MHAVTDKKKGARPPPPNCSILYQQKCFTTWSGKEKIRPVEQILERRSVLYNRSGEKIRPVEQILERKSVL